MCMQSYCLVLRSQLVHECQSWKGAVLKGFSQLLPSQVIPPSLRGLGDQPSGPWPPGPPLSPLHCLHGLSVCRCVCDVCECRAVPRVGGYLCSTVLAQS